QILLGNEFTLDNKGTYGNVMEKLINSIKLISFRDFLITPLFIIL
ncbi:MAG: hypothetical protein AMDU4_FER2C00075G0001, partial [Ferroplasma sp. Type II]